MKIYILKFTKNIWEFYKFPELARFCSIYTFMLLFYKYISVLLHCDDDVAMSRFVLSNLGDTLTEEEIVELLEQADSDRDGKITYEGLCVTA